MAVSLSKGGKVSLSKAALDSGISGALTIVGAGLGWDIQRYDGGNAFDLDASAFILGSNGKCRNQNDFIYYGHLEGDSVKHLGDNLTGEGDGDDEQITIDLQKLPMDVTKIAITVTIYEAEKRNQNFGQVENAFIRVFDTVSGKEFIRYDLSEDFSIETAIVVGEFYKNNGEWKFNAIGQGFAGGLGALCSNYGIDT